MLGCLPRTPSPEAELTPSIDNSNEVTSHNANVKVAPQDRDQEIRDLRVSSHLESKLVRSVWLIHSGETCPA